MPSNGHASSHLSRPNGASSAATIPEYMVIVHPAGQLDDAEAASFWTEVPAFAACSSGGATLQQAVDNTRLAISSWMSYMASREAAAPAPSARAFELVVERAF